MQILMITSEWPMPGTPNTAPFIVRQVEFLRNAGVEVEVFPFRGSGSPLRYLRAWLQVHSKITQSRYDLVHAQFGQSGLLAVFPKRLPLVVTFRGSDAKGIVGANQRYTHAGKILQLLSSLVAKVADQAIVVSESLIDLLPARQYHVIPSGLDFSLFVINSKLEAQKQLGLELGLPLILFSGSKLEPRKRYDLAEDVMEIVSEKFPGARLITVDSTSHNRMPIYLNACDALLSTSMHEGSPNMVKEALACNLPIISTDVGDVRQRIELIDGCFICDGDDPEIIALALIQALSSGKRIKGRETVQHLDENLLTQKVIGVYEKAIFKSPQKHKKLGKNIE